MNGLPRFLAWLLCCVVIATVHADTVEDWIAKGCPSPEKEWTAKDYAALRQLLASKTLPLLRRDADPAGAVFRRLTNTKNFAFHLNHSIPLKSRFPDLLDLMDHANGIMKLYLQAMASGEKVEREQAELLVFLVAGASVELELVEAFIPTIPKDQLYERRMAGLAQAKQGLITMLDGALTSLSERKVYSDESIATIARGLRQYYPKFEPMLPASVKLEFGTRVDSLIQKEDHPAVKQELEALKKAMQGK